MEQLHHPIIPGTDLRLNIRTIKGQNPTIVFLHGLASSLEGSKGNFLANFAGHHSLGVVRFDYRGHGMSDGNFTECSLLDWKEDALLTIDQFTEGPLILVGSSIGAWVGLLAALERKERMAGFVGIASAVDITQHLFKTLPLYEREALEQTGVCKTYPSYGTSFTLSQKLLQSGQDNLLMENSIPLHCPIRLLHGEKDTEVPLSYSLRLAAALESEDVHTILIKDGDHRLSRDQDLAVLEHTLLLMIKNYQTTQAYPAPANVSVAPSPVSSSASGKIA